MNSSSSGWSGRSQWATPGQITHIKTMLAENKLYTGMYDRLWKQLAAHEIDVANPGDGAKITFVNAGKIITWVRADVAKRRGDVHLERPAVTPGVYRKDGEIYVVVPNKNGTRVYAKRLTESPPRMTENGQEVSFKLEYVRGVIFDLAESDRMTLADAKDLIVKYGRCIRCCRTLKAAKTLKTAEDTGVLVGPVCRKYFAS